MSDTARLSINTLRFLAADAVEQAASGHPGMPMGAAPMAYALWQEHLKHDPADPDWFDRDRFVLSAGHGSMLLYGLLHLAGYEDVSMDEIRNFRQFASRTPGHPEAHVTRGVEATTGPLGQGFGNGVGMALAERFLAARYNRPGHEIIDHCVYVICSDGDLMEGVASEAASLAGHLRLGKLICLYDDNEISIDGSTSLAFTEDVAARFEAYGWHVQSVDDGNDLAALDRAIRAAQDEADRPSLIRVRTHIGFGSPKQDTADAHGAPLGEEALIASKRTLDWPLAPRFHVPDEVRRHMSARERGAAARADWRRRFDAYRDAHPDAAAELERAIAGELPDDFDEALPSFAGDDKPMATRSASGKAINALAGRLPTLIGGSADLAGSNNTTIEDEPAQSVEVPGGRNIHFGVREHAMGAALNGMALHGGVLPYGGTFLIFSDYMRPSMRLAALTRLHTLYVLTHDSVGLGEDGPTHQPVEHLMSLRAIPGMTVLRPADANETVEAWRVAVRRAGPVVLALSRQKLPVLDPDEYPVAEGVARGAYTLWQPDGAEPAVVLIATGSEVELCLRAARRLADEYDVPARVVSMPSWELFAEQPSDYRAQVLPDDVPRVSVEAGVTLGWERWIGAEGLALGLDRFGVSAPGKQALEQLGFNEENVIEHALRIARQRAGQPAA